MLQCKYLIIIAILCLTNSCTGPIREYFTITFNQAQILIGIHIPVVTELYRESINKEASHLAYVRDKDFSLSRETSMCAAGTITFTEEKIENDVRITSEIASCVMKITVKGEEFGTVELSVTLTGSTTLTLYDTTDNESLETNFALFEISIEKSEYSYFARNNIDLYLVEQKLGGILRIDPSKDDYLIDGTLSSLGTVELATQKVRPQDVFEATLFGNIQFGRSSAIENVTSALIDKTTTIEGSVMATYLDSFGVSDRAQFGFALSGPLTREAISVEVIDIEEGSKGWGDSKESLR